MLTRSIAIIITLFSFSSLLYGAVGTIPGKFSVQPNGSAQYQIPIKVAPGTNGMQPNLSLVYNSNAGNGMLGVGWNLSGLSSITRCSANLADDGYIRGVNYDANDRFCLDGQQLVVASGIYGESGSTYHTQKESWKKVLAIGSVGIGLGYFEVKTKDGKTLQYGATTDSQIEPQGRGDVVRVWALNQVEDESGNFITYAYDEDYLNGQYYPSTIAYGENSSVGSVGNNLIEFKYDAVRLDGFNKYLSGSKIKTEKRLVQIIHHAGVVSNIVKQYIVEYKDDTENRIMLSKISECDVNGECIEPIRVNWQPNSSGFSSTVTSGVIDWGLNEGRSWVDFDGDGLSDYCRRVGAVNGVSSYVSCTLSTGTGFGETVRSDVLDWGFAEGRQWVDFNGDGMADYCRVRGATNGINSIVSCTLSTGSGFGKTVNSSVLDWGLNEGRSWVDFNGDGLSDYCRRVGSVNGVSSYVSCTLSTGTGFGETVRSDVLDWGFAEGRQWVDFNGDGMADYCRVRGATNGVNSIVSCTLSTGAGFGKTVTSGVIDWGYTDGRSWVDFNGDGLSDYCRRVGSVNGVSSYVSCSKSSERKFAKVESFYSYSSYVRRLQYKPLTNNSVYSKGIISTYPYRSVQTSQYVVSSQLASSDIYGINQTNYTYGALKLHTTARKSLGFAWIQKTNATTGAVTKTEFNQAYDGTEGTPRRVTKTVNGVVVEEVTNSWQSTPVAIYGGVNKTVNLSSSSKISRDLTTGLQATTVTSDFLYDDYGNPTRILKQFHDGYRHETSTQYDYSDVSLGLISKPYRTQKTVYKPDGTSKTQTSQYLYIAGTMKLQKAIIEPDDPTKTLTKSFGYDTFGNRISETVSGADIVTRTTSTTYDSNGRLKVSLSNALGHTETYDSYDPAIGKATQMTGPNGGMSRWVYDGFGRKTFEQRVDGSTTSISYEACTAAIGFSCPTTGVWFAKAEASGEASVVEIFDSLNRKVRTAKQGFGGSWIYEDVVYNNLGQVAKQSLPYYINDPVFWTEIQYDALGRKSVTTSPGELAPRITTTSYNGLELILTNAKGQTTRRLHNSQGKVVLVTDPTINITAYDYDHFGELSKVVDAAGNIISMEYDNRGRKLAMNDPDMGRWTYQYNVLGELRFQTDAKSVTTEMQYDPLGRITKRIEPEGTSIWIYDQATNGIGKVTNVTSPNYVKSYNYDGFGRLGSESTNIGANSYTQSYTYDANGRTKTITYPVTGLKVEYVYNTLGYLDKVVDAANQAEFWRADYVDALGNVVTETLGNGSFTNRVIAATTGTMNGIQTYGALATDTVQDLSYGYDVLGNLENRSDVLQNINESFSYDDLNRLTGVTGPDAKSYSYDAIGNITYKADVGSYTYDQTGLRPHAVTATTGVVNANYSYDANGNMSSGAGRTLTYTSFNKPSRIVAANGSITDLTYDVDHNRLTKTVGTKIVSYIGGLIEKTETATTVEYQQFIKVNGSAIAIRVVENGTFKNDLYLHRDHLGSVDTITDESGAVVERMSFDAFGKRRLPASWTAGTITPVLDTLRVGYTGHEMDDESGLINMGARMYDPVLGRFLSADPTVAYPYSSQGFNRYSYTDNNPLSRVDPTGYNWLAIRGIGKMVIGFFMMASGTPGVMDAGIAFFGSGVDDLNHFITGEQQPERDVYIGFNYTSYSGWGWGDTPPLPGTGSSEDWNVSIAPPPHIVDLQLPEFSDDEYDASYDEPMVVSPVGDNEELIVTDIYGNRNKPYKGFHSAIDGRNGEGAPVRSTEPGVVLTVDATKNGTTYIQIKGDVSRHIHGYYHTTAANGISDRVRVSAGQIIGYTDRSGISTGPHLHFVVQRGTSRLTRYNPVEYFNRYAPSLNIVYK